MILQVPFLLQKWNKIESENVKLEIKKSSKGGRKKVLKERRRTSASPSQPIISSAIVAPTPDPMRGPIEGSAKDGLPSMRPGSLTSVPSLALGVEPSSLLEGCALVKSLNHIEKGVTMKKNSVACINSPNTIDLPIEERVKKSDSLSTSSGTAPSLGFRGLPTSKSITKKQIKKVSNMSERIHRIAVVMFTIGICHLVAAGFVWLLFINYDLINPETFKFTTNGVLLTLQIMDVLKMIVICMSFNYNSA
jgi:hypothetical protein